MSDLGNRRKAFQHGWDACWRFIYSNPSLWSEQAGERGCIDTAEKEAWEKYRKGISDEDE